MVTGALASPSGAFAAPRYYTPDCSPAYAPARVLFDQLEWGKGGLRADALEIRFKAFCCLLWAAVEDPDWTIYTILNKSHYDVSKWPIGYRAMRDTVAELEKQGWLVKAHPRERHRCQRYVAPKNSPLRKIKEFKVSEMYWEPPVVSIRRGDKNGLDRAPLDVELMANKTWKAWIAKNLVPPMDELNDKLLSHNFTLFPYGKPNADTFIQPQYHRIYTNIAGFKQTPDLTHGRIYPRNFSFPSKDQGWRQMTLIDGQRTVEVDVHASSLTLLSEHYNYGFSLPDTDDYYAYGPFGNLNRTVVKTTIQAVINGISLERKGWPTSFKEDAKVKHLIVDQEWSDYSSAILAVYPVLASLEADLGLRLMLDESKIIMLAMNNLLDRGIGCLSIHDCLIVPENNVDDARDAFFAAYAKMDWKPPKLRVG